MEIRAFTFSFQLCWSLGFGGLEYGLALGLAFQCNLEDVQSQRATRLRCASYWPPLLPGFFHGHKKNGTESGTVPVDRLLRAQALQCGCNIPTCQQETLAGKVPGLIQGPEWLE